MPAHFLLGLQKAGVKFVAADMPEANEAMVGFMAIFAQYERDLISKRPKAALQAAEERGTRLGNPNGTAALRRAEGATPLVSRQSRRTLIGGQRT